jgi:hypothetical protein
MEIERWCTISNILESVTPEAVLADRASREPAVFYIFESRIRSLKFYLGLPEQRINFNLKRYSKKTN